MKSIHPFYFYYIQLYLVYFVFSTDLQGHLIKSSLSEKIKFCSFLKYLEQENSLYATNLSSTNRFGIEFNGIENIRNQHCSSTYAKKKVIGEADLESSGYYETLTKDDIVQNQYSLLPYPSVTEEDLADEKYYYEKLFSKRRKPYYYNYGITLEALNHFLFEGRNNFR